MIKDIKLIIFDCDGVLVDSEILSAKVLVSIVEQYGIKLTVDDVFEQFLGRSFNYVRRSIEENYHMKLPGHFGSFYQSALAKEFSQNLKATEGLVDVLGKLTVPFCVATSSSPERVEGALKTANLMEWFSGNVFTCSEVKQGKPAPDLFLYAADKMGVEPSKCLIIEDSEAGIAAGFAAKMQVLRYVGGTHLKNKKTTHEHFSNGLVEFDDWKQLLKLAPLSGKLI